MITEENYSTSLALLKETLPSYLCAFPPPPYSSDPACGEERIEHSPPTHAPHPSGTIVHKSGSITVVFTDQASGAATPGIGRQGKLNGAVLLDRHDIVSEVTAHVKGRLHYLNARGGSSSKVTLDRTISLWSAADGESCPSSIPLSATFPATYKENAGKHQALPPSFLFSNQGVVVTSIYALVVRVSYKRRGFGVFPKAKTIRIPLNYHPRTRPNRPIIPVALFCGLKSSPEEWHQTLTEMKRKTKMTVAPVLVNTLIPSAQIYAISDVIPFHIQLSGSLASLQQILPSAVTQSGAPPICVKLLRQVVVDADNTRSLSNVFIGEGKVWAVPPTASQLSSAEQQEEVLDWEGEIQCNKDVTVGGFSASGASVRDFITVTLRPPMNSPFMASQACIPIRLVTDTWIDSPDRS